MHILYMYVGQEDKSSIQCSDCNQPLSSDKEKEEFCDKCLKSQLQICNDDTPTTTPTNTPTKGPPLKTQIDGKSSIGSGVFLTCF